MKLEEKLSLDLIRRQNQNLLRELSISSSNLIDFVSNDYLGIGRNQKVLERVQNEYATTDQWIGSGGSRLLAGNSIYYEQLENFLANIHQEESALLFNSGYVANVAFFATIPQKGDTILYDSLIHACVKDGIRLSLATRYSFQHNSLIHLEKRLQKASGNVFVAIESIYSMDGDEAPLKDLVILCEKYNAYLVIDEAHTTGVYGKKGAGLVCELDLQDRVFARIHTFGKAIGAHGACIVGKEYLKKYLINFARQFIYTTSLPTHSLIAIHVAYQAITSSIQENLQQKINLFKKHYIDTFVESRSPIQVILCRGNEYAKSTALQLQRKGFDIRPILSPTVKEGTERLRICLHVHNTDEEIINLTNALKEIKND